jgi:hypothetical protein
MIKRGFLGLDLPESGLDSRLENTGHVRYNQPRLPSSPESYLVEIVGIVAVVKGHRGKLKSLEIMSKEKGSRKAHNTGNAYQC